MTTRVEAEALREQIYNLYIKHLTQTQIAKAVGISQPRVAAHIKILRQRNAHWFNSHKDPTHRMRRLLKETVDGMGEVLREQWYTYTQARVPPTGEKQASVSVRSGILSNILNTYVQIQETLGIWALQLDELSFIETAQKLQAELDNMKNELSQKAKVKRLP